jgi:sec-independent protein translocase protein TatB
MFGIDFSEILVIFVIALVVLGPERLPKLAQTIGRWLGRARSMARQFREQLEQEASRLQTETKNVHDSLDLNAAQRSTHQAHPDSGQADPFPSAGPAAATSASTPAGSPPTEPAPVHHSDGQAAAAAHPSAGGEFSLHNAGAPEPPTSPQPHASGAAAAAPEPAVAVEAHER